MKTTSAIRRLIPHMAIVALCGLVVFWMLRGQSVLSSSVRATGADTARAQANGIASHEAHAVLATGDASCPHCAKAGSSTGATIAEVVNKIEPANSPVVENLLRNFRKGDRSITPSSFEVLKTREIGKHVTFTAGGIEWNGILDSRSDNPEVFHAGVTLDDQLGRFQFSLREDHRMQTSVRFYGESLALVANGMPEDGSWKMELSSMDTVICTPTGVVYSPDGEATGTLKAPAGAAGVQHGPLTTLPLLSSKPKSTFVLYMDFDGEVVTHPGWNNGKKIDAQPDPRANDATYVTNVWKRVSEDFAPFDLNVTTDRAVFDAAAVSRRVMCVCTPTNTAAPGAGGVAYLGSFGQDTPCWNFNINSEYASADTVSHEVGHTLGLSHDGTDKEAYYGGHGGTGPYSWSPIMGAAWANPNYEEVTQFSKGEYPKANNKEDDLTIITTKNGFGYEKDDKGDSQATATYLKTVDGKVADSGIIERTTDTDWLSFLTSGGSVTLNFNVTDVNSSENPQRGANLALSAELYDASGKLIKSVNDPNQPDASISTNLEAGTYFVKLDGVSRGTLATGFPEYGSLGQYYISGSIPQTGLITVNPPTSSFTPRAGTGSFNVTTTYPWTWSCSESWVTSSEATSQSGNQQFTFSVAPNPDTVARTAVIYLSVGGYAVSHTITQGPKGTDDHSNFINGATPISQNSITTGIIETEGDLDVFQIKATLFGELTVQTSGSTNTFGELLDDKGATLVSNDNALLPNFRITRQISPGTYYVRVRHALERGTGAYTLVAKMNARETLSITPLSRDVAASAGDYGFSVVSNTAWSWTCDVPWLTSAEPANQIFGQAFNYAVAANTTPSSRTGHITLTAGALTVTHTIVQIGTLTDDHGNTPALATNLQINGSVSGKIESVGDVDVFRVILPSVGELKVGTTGTTDTYGYLLDANGAVLASNDDLVGDNFGINYKANAGTYYVKVRHFSSNGTGTYTLNNTFVPAKFVNVKYTASSGGSLTGIAIQTVAMGGNASVVTAVPKPGYAFIRWSDGRALAARDDRNLVSHLTVNAEFAPILSVSILGGAMLQDNQFPKIDYGIRWINEIVPMSFEIRNNGPTSLTQLKVTKAGLDISLWTLSDLPVVTLEPGQSTILTATLQAPDRTAAGYKNAIFTVTATGTGALPFRIPVMASILNNVVVESSSNSTAQTSHNDSKSSGKKSPHAAGSIHHAASPVATVAVSPDGLFRHSFRLPKQRRGIPDFFVSEDGISWVPADLISVRKTGQNRIWNEFEALLSPAGIDSPVILVSETLPSPGSP